MIPDSRKDRARMWLRRTPPPLLLAVAFVASFLIIAIPLYQELEEFQYIRPGWDFLEDELPAMAPETKVDPLLDSLFEAFLFSFPFALALVLIHHFRSLPRLSVLGACTFAGIVHILGIYLLYPSINSLWHTLVFPFMIAALPMSDLMVPGKKMLRPILCLGGVCVVLVAWQVLRIVAGFPGEPAEVIVVGALQLTQGKLPPALPFIIAWALIPPLVPNEPDSVTSEA